MISSLLDKLPKATLGLLRMIGAYADTKGVGCYLVGGVVRDLLLDKPTLDLDIVIEADAIEFSKALSQKHQTAITIHPRFKTATLVWPGQVIIDFVSARKESYPTSGALPVVDLGTIKEDLLRRDFTINALAICLNQSRQGELLDEAEGLKDLQEKKIRIFHARSFYDDPTRVLRAVRFEQRYQFKLEAQTQKCLEQAVRERFDRQVSPGRYFEEFKKILKEQKPWRYLRRLNELNGLNFLGDKFTLNHEKEKYCEALDEVLAWMASSCHEKAAVTRWLVYMMILFDDYTMDEMKDCLNHFSLSRHDGKQMLSSKLEYEVVKRLDMSILRPSQVHQVLQFISLEELVFFLVKTRGRPPEPCIKNFLTDYRHIHLFLKGDDLMRLGVRDGKKMGEILKRLLEKKIDAGMATKEKEFQMLKQIEKEVL